ncbi:uncharacterized protein EI90DRAFT_2829001, partial [Cantharellus anzutake]
DRTIVNGWLSALDMLMLFAGLFAAILSAFLIESSRDLRAKDITVLSDQIARLLSNVTSTDVGSEVGDSGGRFHPSTTTIVVNRLWYSSLGITLSSTVILMLAKQWLEEYRTSGMSLKFLNEDSLEGIKHQASLVAYRSAGLSLWIVPEIIGVLPIALHIALLLFAGGL